MAGAAAGGQGMGPLLPGLPAFLTPSRLSVIVQATLFFPAPLMIRHPFKKWLQMAPIRIILPVILTVALFTGTIFFLILPILEARMMDQRRLMIRELNETAWSLLSALQEKERSGEATRREAQAQAIETLRSLRYGPDAKDYFWINDLHPNLIMHPYRPDLEGRDVSHFTDPSGKRLFAAVVNAVRETGAAFVDYQWQWKDDPERIVPKISHVKVFSPWGWVVGTGIYVEDVRAEIAAITRRLTGVCLAILAVILLLSGYIIRQSSKAKRRRHEIDLALRESEQKYRLLAETASEFIIAFDAEGRIIYVNRAWIETGGYAPDETSAKRIFELLPDDAQDAFQDRLGQLKARVPEVYGEDNPSPWAMPCVAYAGANHGLVVLPEVEDGIWIEFEAGDISRPIWTGCWWADDEMPEAAGPETKVLVTTGGHQLILDDDQNEIRLVHARGAEIAMTENDITIKINGKEIELSSSGVNINNGAFEVK